MSLTADQAASGLFPSHNAAIGYFPEPPDATLSKEKFNTIGSRKTPPQTPSVQDIGKALITPFVAIVYLAFCYTVHSRPVRLANLIDVTPENLSVVKSAVTTTSIVVIFAGLYPLKCLISESTSEEFFRTLRTHPNGVHLSSLNDLSKPTLGMAQSMKAIWRNQTSRYYSAVFIAGFAVTATSTLAPSTLTIQTVFTDGDVMAFGVGAVRPSSIYNTLGLTLGENFTINSVQSAGVAWAETTFNMTYSFSITAQDGKNYVVPAPRSLPKTSVAHYLTDVAILNPTCSFPETNVTGTMNIEPHSRSTVTLLPIGFPNEMTITIAPRFSSSAITLLPYIQDTKGIPGLSAGIVTSGVGSSIPTDGSVIWQITHCTAGLGCPKDPDIKPVDFNLASLPTINVVVDNVTLEITYLICRPGAHIETREIRSDGQGALIVLPSPFSPLTRQNNLDRAQTNLLLSGVFNDIAGDFLVGQKAAGPGIPNYPELGSLLENSMIFGLPSLANISLPSTSDAINKSTTTLTPLPTANITQAYTKILSSATKYFMLSDVLGTAFVPGRIASEEVIFSASTPYIIVSTVLFAVLSVLVVGAQWRTAKGERFTVVGLGGVLHSGSFDDAARVLGDAKRDAEAEVNQSARKGRSIQRDCDAVVVKRLGEKVVSLRRTTGGEALCIGSVD